MCTSACALTGPATPSRGFVLCVQMKEAQLRRLEHQRKRLNRLERLADAMRKVEHENYEGVCRLVLLLRIQHRRQLWWFEHMQPRAPRRRLSRPDLLSPSDSAARNHLHQENDLAYMAFLNVDVASFKDLLVIFNDLLGWRNTVRPGQKPNCPLAAAECCRG